MATVKLTKTRVDAVKPAAVPVYLWDAELKGFGLRCSPAGIKSYVVQYRAGGGGRSSPKLRVTIGRHGSPWTADTARSEAKRLLGAVAHGGDPASERQAARKAETVSELIDLYLSEGCAHKKPSTIATDRPRFEHHIRPHLGKRKVADVTRADIERLMTDVIAGRTVRPVEGPRRPGSAARGGKGVAGQVVTLLGVLFAFAVKRGMRPNNPAHGIDKPAPRKMERFLTSEEIGRLGAALSAEEKSTGNPSPSAVIRLLLLTGARRSEITELRRTSVDLERGALFLADSKTGPKSIHLNAPAAAVLAGLPRVAGNPSVFPGARAEQLSSGLDKVWARVRVAAALPNVRLHDLRHSAASIAAARGASLLLIGRVLGHRQATTTERYSHLTADPVKATAELIGVHVAAALGLSEEATAAEVMPFRGR
jgi:integrase